MTRGALGAAARAGRNGLRRAMRTGVDHGLPPQWVGYRWIRHETVAEHVARSADSSYTTIHPEEVRENPLPIGVASADELPADRGWWRFSFRDVPQRISGETFLATIRDCVVTWYHDERQGGEFHPAIVSADGRSLDLREIRFRQGHGDALRQGGQPQRIRRGVWVLERVYENHSHWLTAHLPKLLLLERLGLLNDALLPSGGLAEKEPSMRAVGLDPEAATTFDLSRPLHVEELTVVGTDRFRPELIEMVQDSLAPPAREPHRRVYISRSQAGRRRLVNEEDLIRVLEPAGFEIVHMERLSFEQQLSLMRETAVLMGPHGAGLTNMMLCPPGAEVVEIADPHFPNPNFYALACASGHRYRFLPARSVGDGERLARDLWTDVDRVERIVSGSLS